MGFNNLKIATRLWVAVGIILVTLTGALITDHVQSAALQKRMETTLEQLNLRLRTVGTWSALTQANAVRSSAVLNSTDPNIETLFKTPIADTSAKINEFQAKIEAMPLGPEEKAQMAKIMENRKTVLAIREKARELKSSGNQDEATKVFNSEYLPASDTYLKSIDDLVRLEEKIADSFMSDISSAKSNLQQTIMAMIGVLLVGIIIGSTLLIRTIQKPLSEAVNAANAIAAGKLDTKLDLSRKDEFGILAVSINHMISNISKMVATVGSNAVLVSHTGHVQSEGNRSLTERTEQQAANLEETSASIQEVSRTVKQTADSAGEVNRKATEVREIAEQGASSMQVCVESITEIQQSAHRMNEIISVIDGLAFQTNILALNAAVEAARAGESGRGFAVVAAEVRSLAQRSGDSSREIRKLIESSRTQVESSVGLIRVAGDAMSRIVVGIRALSESVSQISNASADQNTVIEEISAATQQLDMLTRTNAKMVEKAVEESKLLEMRAETLVFAIGQFKLQQGVPEEAVALVKRATDFRNQQHSRDSFLRGITDKANGFFDRDMYVFALDDNGTYLAFGGNQAKVGTRVQDIPGIDGAKLVRAIIDQCESGPGWVEYDITNPTTNQVQSKMSYVTSVDDVYLGCGVYKSLI